MACTSTLCESQHASDCLLAQDTSSLEKGPTCDSAHAGDHQLQEQNRSGAHRHMV